MLSGASEELASLLNKRRSIAECSNTGINAKEPKDCIIKITNTTSIDGNNIIKSDKHDECNQKSNSKSRKLLDNVNDYATTIKIGNNEHNIIEIENTKSQQQQVYNKQKRRINNRFPITPPTTAITEKNDKTSKKEGNYCHAQKQKISNELKSSKSFPSPSTTTSSSSSSSWLISSSSNVEDVSSIASSKSSISRRNKYFNNQQQKQKKNELLPCLIEVPSSSSNSNLSSSNISNNASEMNVKKLQEKQQVSKSNISSTQNINKSNISSPTSSSIVSSWRNKLHQKNKVHPQQQSNAKILEILTAGSDDAVIHDNSKESNNNNDNNNNNEEIKSKSSIESATSITTTDKNDRVVTNNSNLKLKLNNYSNNSRNTREKETIIISSKNSSNNVVDKNIKDNDNEKRNNYIKVNVNNNLIKNESLTEEKQLPHDEQQPNKNNKSISKLIQKFQNNKEIENDDNKSTENNIIIKSRSKPSPSTALKSDDDNYVILKSKTFHQKSDNNVDQNSNLIKSKSFQDSFTFNNGKVKGDVDDMDVSITSRIDSSDDDGRTIGIELKSSSLENDQEVSKDHEESKEEELICNTNVINVNTSKSSNKCVVANRIKNFQKPRIIATVYHDNKANNASDTTTCMKEEIESSSSTKSDINDERVIPLSSSLSSKNYTTSTSSYKNESSASQSIKNQQSVKAKQDKEETCLIETSSNITLLKGSNASKNYNNPSKYSTNITDKKENKTTTLLEKIKTNMNSRSKICQSYQDKEKKITNKALLSSSTKIETKKSDLSVISTNNEKPSSVDVDNTMSSSSSFPKRHNTTIDITSTSLDNNKTLMNTNTTIPRWKKKIELTNSINPKRNKNIYAPSSSYAQDNNSMLKARTIKPSSSTTITTVPSTKKNILRSSFLEKIIPTNNNDDNGTPEIDQSSTESQKQKRSTPLNKNDNKLENTKNKDQMIIQQKSNVLSASPTKPSVKPTSCEKEEENESIGTASTATESDIIISNDNYQHNSDFVIRKLKSQSSSSQHDNIPSLKSSSVDTTTSSNSSNSAHIFSNLKKDVSTIQIQQQHRSCENSKSDKTSWLCCPASSGANAPNVNNNCKDDHNNSSSTHNNVSMISLPRPYKVETTSTTTTVVSSSDNDPSSSSSKAFSSYQQFNSFSHATVRAKNNDDDISIDSINGEIRERSWTNHTSVNYQYNNNNCKSLSNTGIEVTMNNNKSSNSSNSKTQLTVITSLSPHSASNITSCSKDTANTAMISLLSPPKKIHHLAVTTANSTNKNLISPKYINKGQANFLPPPPSTTANSSITTQSNDNNRSFDFLINNKDISNKNNNYVGCFDVILPSSSTFESNTKNNIHQPNNIIIENQRLKEEIQSLKNHNTNSTESFSSDHHCIHLKDQVTVLQSQLKEKDKIIFMLKKKIDCYNSRSSHNHDQVSPTISADKYINNSGSFGSSIKNNNDFSLVNGTISSNNSQRFLC